MIPASSSARLSANVIPIPILTAASTVCGSLPANNKWVKILTLANLLQKIPVSVIRGRHCNEILVTDVFQRDGGNDEDASGIATRNADATVLVKLFATGANLMILHQVCGVPARPSVSLHLRETESQR